MCDKQSYRPVHRNPVQFCGQRVPVIDADKPVERYWITSIDLLALRGYMWDRVLDNDKDHNAARLKEFGRIIQKVMEKQRL